jgi:hypothetical protein
VRGSGLYQGGRQVQPRLDFEVVRAMPAAAPVITGGAGRPSAAAPAQQEPTMAMKFAALPRDRLVRSAVDDDRARLFYRIFRTRPG